MLELALEMNPEVSGLTIKTEASALAKEKWKEFWSLSRRGKQQRKIPEAIPKACSLEEPGAKTVGGEQTQWEGTLKAQKGSVPSNINTFVYGQRWSVSSTCLHY